MNDRELKILKAIAFILKIIFRIVAFAPFALLYKFERTDISFELK